MKKINLLPAELKSAELFNAFRKLAIVVAIIPVLYLAYLGFVNIKTYNEIEDIKSKIATVETLENSIKAKKDTVVSKQEFLSIIDVQEFPFTDFVKFIQNKTPEDLTVISIDTTDRLETAEPDTAVTTVENTASVGDALSNSIDETTDLENLGNEQITTTEIIPGQTPSKQTDLEKRNERIVIRGYSSNNVSIADFVYSISLLDYINDVSLTAIEERMIDDKLVNVFEVIVDSSK